MNKQQLPKAELSTLAKLVDGDRTLFGQALAISERGLWVKLPIGLEPSRPIFVSFRLDIKEKPLTAQTEVAATKAVGPDNQYVVVLKFTEIGDEETSRIQEFVGRTASKS